MTSTLEDRAKDISPEDIKRIQETDTDNFSFEVTSQNPKNQKEVIWMVYKSISLGWTCTCPAFIYSKTPENPTCKHIIRVKEIYKIE